jgi:hypothetical protein
MVYRQVLFGEYKEISSNFYKLIDNMSLFLRANLKIIKDYETKVNKSKQPTKLMLRATLLMEQIIEKFKEIQIQPISNPNGLTTNIF